MKLIRRQKAYVIHSKAYQTQGQYFLIGRCGDVVSVSPRLADVMRTAKIKKLDVSIVLH